MPKIQIRDLQLNYETYGNGEPLVLIPGFRTGLWLWFKQVETFAQKFRTIVFDPRGIGASDSSNAPLDALLHERRRPVSPAALACHAGSPLEKRRAEY